MPTPLLQQKPSFKRAYKKLHPNQQQVVRDAIQEIMKNPESGVEKKGDLRTVFVYKFNCVGQQYLLAYQWDLHHRTLLSVGPHENFYRNLKQSEKR